MDALNPRTVTIELGGGGDTATEEIIRGLHDSLRATSIALADDELLPGAGSIHARMAAGVRRASEEEPGRARLAMDAYARALETIPSTLVENSGGDSLDRVLELRAAQMMTTSRVSRLRVRWDQQQEFGIPER
ncbi:MAG: hypothetical protein CM1200mP21_09470 [Candidatus Poseidoniales archaeon]|nr:MAG: hypothetical protein CM1200mP21_09470 [Candidatus Poseidoniales archaeon]